MNTGKEKKIRTVFFASLFLGICFFYIRLYPLILSSPDDWRYINYWRDFAFAALGRGWNPGRVLPEVLMPLGAQIGVYAVWPFFHNSIGFIRAVSIGLALVVACFMVLYLYSFDFLLRKRFAIGIYSEMALTGLFFLFHFWIFRSAQSDNTYLFDGFVPNLYYFYVIPYMLNFTVCLLWMSVKDDEVITRFSRINKSLVILLVYFAVFSNLFSSVVVAVYAGIRFLNSMICDRNIAVKTKLFRVRYELIVLTLWFYSLVAEALGGNANHLTSQMMPSPFVDRIKETLSNSFELISHMNKYFLLISFVLIVYLVFCIIKTKKNLRLVCGIVIHVFLVFVYQILLSSVVGPDYISRAMVSATYLVGLLALDIISIYEIISLKREIIIFIPLATLIIVSMINTTAPVFNSSASQLIMLERLDEYYVDVITEADKRGDSEVCITMPQWYAYGLNDSADLFATYISSTLYKYGITSRVMKLSFEED